MTIAKSTQETKELKKCEFCGKDFEQNKSNIIKQKYCSQICRINGWKKKREEFNYGFKKGTLNPSCHPERREEMRNSMLGKVPSEISRKRLSKTMKIILKSPELKEKWRKAQLGRKHTQETIKKILQTKSKRIFPLKSWIWKADRIFSEFIRKVYSSNGLVACFTCGKVVPINKADNGHFVTRQCKSLRYSEKNCHPQCIYCNRYQEGLKDVYAVKLQEKYGMGILQELYTERQKVTILEVEDYQRIFNEYKQRIKEFEQ